MGLDAKAQPAKNLFDLTQLRSVFLEGWIMEVHILKKWLYTGSVGTSAWAALNLVAMW
jgi:hypothetical protein